MLYLNSFDSNDLIVINYVTYLLQLLIDGLVHGSVCSMSKFLLVNESGSEIDILVSSTGISIMISTHVGTFILYGLIILHFNEYIIRRFI